MPIVLELLSKKLEQKFDTLSNVCEGINQLIDVNECNYLVNLQMKQDVKIT